MAVAVDNNTDYSAAGFNSTHTISGFDCSGTDSHLLVAAYLKENTSELSSITADGNTMSRRGQSGGGGVAGVEAFDYTINDASFDIVGNTPSFKELAYTAIALSGVDQSTPATGTPVTASGFSSAPSVSYTGTTGNELFLIVNVQGTRTLAVTGTGNTLVSTFQPSSSIGACLVSHVTATGSSQTLGASVTGGDTNWHAVVVEVAVASGGITQIKYYNGTSFVTKPLNVIT